MKRLIICCDGTWNRPDQVSAGKACPTNVTKVALAIAPHDPSGVLQHVYYDRGVGTGRWDRFRGGALGSGLSTNIRQAYRFLIRHYRPGDEIILFGFSRGAHTVPSLAGLIRNCGILRVEHADRLGQGYALYRRRDEDSNPRAIEAQLFRRSYSYESQGYQVRIKCIAVWDTVGALGIPVGILGQPTRQILHLQFHDVKLSSFVDNAFQALAVDEHRLPFEPCLWEQQSHSVGQKMEQVWFAGVHSNVGGGYPDSGLSDTALLWLLGRTKECGLEFDEAYLRANAVPNPWGVLRNSRMGLYRLLPARYRRVASDGLAPRFESVHPSVYERVENDRSYRPANLPLWQPRPLAQAPGVIIEPSPLSEIPSDPRVIAAAGASQVSQLPPETIDRR